MNDRSKRPAINTPVNKKRKHHIDSRTKVQTAEGKQVLSSDMRLHLQKIRYQQARRQAELEEGNDSDEELNLLEQEVKRLQDKLEKHKEI